MNNNILHKLFLTLTLVLLTLGASAQVTVSGNVSDESGEPIIGATVMEALTTNGVVTDFDGNFKIQVKNENATLKISYDCFLRRGVVDATQFGCGRAGKFV